MGNRIDDLFALEFQDRIESSSVLRRASLENNFDLIVRLTAPFIDGIEVTQGIQYYKASRHLTDPNDRGADNSVRLVANKPAWARVYVRTGMFGSSQNVTGELVIERNGGPLQPIWQPVTTLTPQPPASVATQSDPNYALERSTIGSTLNFIIPLDVMWGSLRVTARIWAVGGNAGSPLSTEQVTLDVTLLQTLSLRGILISYNGPDPTVNPNNPPNINLPAPTLANLQATAAWTLTTNPVQSQGIFSSAGSLQWSTPLTGVATNPGGCSTQWIALNAAVAQVKANDGNRTDVIYYGLLPAGTPIANVGGCESSGVSTGPNNQQVVMAHEIGHGAGLQHGPCGTPGDVNYPAYEPYDPLNTPTASLGEYGLDINNGTIHPPTEKDYMSYCGQNWISLFHHARLSNNAKFNPKVVGVFRLRLPLLVDPYLWPWEYIPDPPEWERNPGEIRMKAEKVISLIGVVNEERQMQVQSVMRVKALRGGGESLQTPFVAQLIGRDGKVAASAPVMQLVSSGHGCGCGPEGDAQYDERKPFAFQAFVPDVEPGTALRIVRRGLEDEADKEVWMRRAPEQEPRISNFNLNVVKTQITVSWEGRCAPSAQQPEFSIQFSKDEGRSWNGLAVGVRGNNYKFELSDLPSGTLIFRLLVHDGFFTSVFDSKPMKLAKRPPVASILYPQEGPELIAGRPMRLWAAVSTSTGELIDPKVCRWMVDGKDVARGLEGWTIAPSGGKHRCTFIIEDDTGRTDVSGTFTTVDFDRIATPSATTSATPTATREIKPAAKSTKSRAKKGRKSSR